MQTDDYGSRLRDERKRLDLTQEALALSLSINRATVANCEIGKSFLDMRLLERADQIGLDVMYLLTGRRQHSNVDWRLMQTINKEICVWAREQDLELDPGALFLIQKALYEKFVFERDIDHKGIEAYLRTAA